MSMSRLPRRMTIEQGIFHFEIILEQMNQVILMNDVLIILLFRIPFTPQMRENVEALRSDIRTNFIELCEQADALVTRFRLRERRKRFRTKASKIQTVRKHFM